MGSAIIIIIIQINSTLIIFLNIFFTLVLYVIFYYLQKFSLYLTIFLIEGLLILLGNIYNKSKKLIYQMKYINYFCK